ncbi:N-acetyllactosaminide beta-1,3-N-acetylglucosaminyltransferase 2-like [Thalassophryne amazonica]|uniref:N-acetyllactosaminide beta-1,3-N-acetylglucosaminyltransferase 2-like n=1 Tax=Thalassophryne amazonica TaxID=390379 RepID=UPI0014719470|nr:N-acetyllactosaminide beta-1,3-N-acetylglucosaminyltransferase 2-like [Thalassophryne amazonica]
MARCFCRWRNMLICVCTPCMTVMLFFVYITVALYTNLSASMRDLESTVHHLLQQQIHFVAPGTIKNESFAPLPKTFWDLQPHGNAIWNQLQIAIDRSINPILHPNRRRFIKNRDDELLMNKISLFTNSVIVNDSDNLPQQIRRFLTHMHRRDYPILIHPSGMCGVGSNKDKGRPLLLFAIKTTVDDFKNRHAIRNTWAKVGWVAGQRRNSSTGRKGGAYIRRVFLLGKQNTQKMGVDHSELLQMENDHHGDILQWDFEDTFFNLTLKDVLFWSWFSSFCKGTHFVFKGDDDVFVNTPAMIDYLHSQLTKPNTTDTMRDFMVGDVINAAMPIRENNSKYFIPESFYKGVFPSYAGGGGVVYSGLLAKRLHHVSKRVHLFPIDDVYVGMCVLRLNASPIVHPAFLTFDFQKGEKLHKCTYHTILLVRKRNPAEILKLWAYMKKRQQQCWHVRLRDKETARYQRLHHTADFI